MKSNITTKIKISIFLCIISLIYFFCFDFLLYGHFLLYGYLVFSPFSPLLLLLFWPIVLIIFYSFISVFIYPYIKIDSQSVLKRGLFFGAIIWIIDTPQLVMNLRYTLMMFDVAVVIPLAISFIKNPLYFIILGLVTSFCYKKLLLEEFNLPLKKLKIPFAKVAIAIVLTTLIYTFFMYFTQALILYALFHIDVWDQIIIDLLHPLLYINSLIYGLIFTVLYTTTIRKVSILRTKKWVLFSLFVSFFTTPLILLGEAIVRGVFQEYIIIHQLLLIPHLLAIFVIGYLFTKLLDEESLPKPLPEIRQ